MDQEPAQTAQSCSDSAAAAPVHALYDTLRFAVFGRQYDGEFAVVG